MLYCTFLHANDALCLMMHVSCFLPHTHTYMRSHSHSNSYSHSLLPLPPEVAVERQKIQTTITLYPFSEHTHSLSHSIQGAYVLSLYYSVNSYTQGFSTHLQRNVKSQSIWMRIGIRLRNGNACSHAFATHFSSRDEGEKRETNSCFPVSLVVFVSEHL